MPVKTQKYTIIYAEKPKRSRRNPEAVQVPLKATVVEAASPVDAFRIFTTTADAYVVEVKPVTRGRKKRDHGHEQLSFAMAMHECYMGDLETENEPLVAEEPTPAAVAVESAESASVEPPLEEPEPVFEQAVVSSPAPQPLTEEERKARVNLLIDYSYEKREQVHKELHTKERTLLCRIEDIEEELIEIEFSIADLIPTLKRHAVALDILAEDHVADITLANDPDALPDGVDDTYAPGDDELVELTKSRSTLLQTQADLELELKIVTAEIECIHIELDCLSEYRHELFPLQAAADDSSEDDEFYEEPEAAEELQTVQVEFGQLLSDMDAADASSRRVWIIVTLLLIAAGLGGAAALITALK